jgi:four helix bundle protein
MSDAPIARPVPFAPRTAATTTAAVPASAAAHGLPADPAGCEPPADEPRFDAEKLDVYRVALDFQALAAELLPRRGQSVLRDQLDRASVSIALNIAEAAGRFSAPDKARFYGIARGSATECAAVLDVLLARGLTSASTYRRARGLLLRVVQMLTKLNLRLTG